MNFRGYLRTRQLTSATHVVEEVVWATPFVRFPMLGFIEPPVPFVEGSEEGMEISILTLVTYNWN